MVKRGMAAYRALEFDAAAALLRLSLTGPDGAALPDQVRAETYTYLGATEYFRGRADSSVAAFRSALIADPLHRPDSLVFPPAVTDAFDAVRKRSVYVRFSAARDTTIPFGEGLYAVRLYASAPHEVTVDLTSEDGRAARHLYNGPIADSLDIHWEGLDPQKEAPLDGPAALMVRSRSSWGEQRVMRLPLRTELIRKDTLPYPPPRPIPRHCPSNGRPGLRLARWQLECSVWPPRSRCQPWYLTPETLSPPGCLWVPGSVRRAWLGLWPSCLAGQSPGMSPITRRGGTHGTGRSKASVVRI